VNTRKDLVCDANDSTSCKNNATWTPVTYDPPYVAGAATALPTTASAADPAIMGYPHDLCHSGKQSTYTCGIKGSAVWDVNAYFRINYNLTETQWRALSGIPNGPYAGNTKIPARYDVYQWEISNQNVGGYGISVYQPVSTPANNAAFSLPASGNGSGVAASASQPDRRTIAAAVLNCQALNVHGKTTNVPVPTWIKVFLTEPAIKRGTGSDLYTDQKDIYVEFIEKTKASEDTFASVVRRDVPYLVK
jgi:hypothetical protein